MHDKCSVMYRQSLGVAHPIVGCFVGGHRISLLLSAAQVFAITVSHQRAKRSRAAGAFNTS